MNDLLPPPTRPVSVERLFSAPPTTVVQTIPEAHEYKKTSGSSDAAHTYDSTKV